MLEGTVPVSTSRSRHFVCLAASALTVLACVPAKVPLAGQSPPPMSAAPTAERPTSVDTSALIAEGETAYSERRFADSARALARAVELGNRDANTAYNAACSYALAGQPAAAFTHLELALANGLHDLEHTRTDSDLNSLHTDPQWAALLERLGAAHERVQAEERTEEARLEDLSAKAEFPHLSRADMYADFDVLVKTIVEVSPQTLVRKAITGLDPIAECAGLRKRIESIRSPEEFALLIRSATTVFQDGHTSLIGKKYSRLRELRQLGVSDQAVALLGKYEQMWRSRTDAKKLVLPIGYIGGEYYVLTDIQTTKRSIPRGSMITHVNGQPIHAYVSSLPKYLPMMRWDFERRRFFSERFYKAQNLTADDRLDITFTSPDGRHVTAQFALREELSAPRKADPPKQVEWYGDLGVLYVRMPTMAVEDADYYPNAIKSAAKGQQVRKVIFDIRGNGGGGDGVWMRALAAVIDQPIEYELVMAFNPTEKLLHRLMRLREAPTFKADFLGGAEFRVLRNEFRIEPDRDSIGFSGRIYVLQDERVYSSAGAFAAVAAMTANVLNVGRPTGWLLGRGVDPWVFELPHSKMLFRVEPAIDFTGAKSAAEVYHDAVELPVESTLEQAMRYAEQGGGPLDKAALLSDAVFLRALKD